MCVMISSFLFIQNAFVMARHFLVALCFCVSLSAFAQPVSADLSLSDNTLTNAMGGDLNANLIGTGQVIRVRVAIGNFVSGVTAPGGHFRLRIGLGNGLVINPGFDFSTAPLSNYFTWSYDLSGAQPQIVGLSKASAPLPDGFIDYADFPLKANTATTSTVSFNLLISNPPNTTTPLSDPAPANNTGSNTYTIVAGAPLPVGFVGFTAVKKGCDINLQWRVENQASLKKYEVEASRNNTSFTRLGEVAAKNETVYAYAFGLTEEWKAPLLYLRIRSVDLDGSFRYSKTVTVAGNCDAKWALALFPNPVKDASVLTVAAKAGIFDGKYKVLIVAANGQIVQQREVTLNGVKSFPLSLPNISSGKYHVSIQGADDAMPTVLDFEKL